MQKKAYINILFFICLSCNKQAKYKTCVTSDNPVLHFQVLNTVNLDVVDAQYDFVSYFTTEIDNKPFYAGYDSYNHRIDFYPLMSSEKSHFIKLFSSGPHAVGDISSVLYHNEDSIFLADSGYGVIFLVNRRGEKINKWISYSKTSQLNGVDFSGNYGLGALDMYGMRLFLRKKKELIVHFMPVSQQADNEFPTIYSLPAIASLSLETGEIASYFGKYPPEYQEDYIPHTLFVSYCLGIDNAIISIYPSSNFIYSSKTDDYVCINSNYYFPTAQRKYSQDDGGSVDAFYEDYEKNGAFDKIVYDRYRNCYYVVVKHPLSNNLDDADKFTANWSLLKMNSDLTVIGECKFPKNKYDYTNIHIVPNGILISLENPYNPNNEEDLLEFQIIELI